MASLLSSSLTVQPHNHKKGVEYLNSLVTSLNFVGLTHGQHLPRYICGVMVNQANVGAIATNTPLSSNSQNAVGIGRTRRCCLLLKAKLSAEADVVAKESVTLGSADDKNDFGVVSMHHVGILCENLERSLDFYQNLLGLEINEARPHDKLPYRGAWLWVGSEMIHLMELPNPDPFTGRPEHGGRDRHTCIAIRDVSKLKAILDKAGIPYTLSRSGRPAIFTRDPDANALEFTQAEG